jgi:predicted CoA-substrate-specific enzyme activase
LTIRAVGIDAGSTTTKVVGVDASGNLTCHRLEPTDPQVAEQVETLLEEAARQAGGSLDRVGVVATGYGRNLVPLPASGRRVTEITCHARGVFRDLGHGGTLVDIGGQDSKVIAIGPGGDVSNFAMNDKCAAGTGRFLEVAAERLRVPLEEMGAVARSAPEEVSISSTCTVFAESEIVSLLARGNPVDHIVRGLHRSLIRRIAALARSAGVRPPLMLSGGVALSPAVQQFLSEELGHPVQLPGHPQLMGAYGAALIALEQAS